jgi:hypothetical protein
MFYKRIPHLNSVCIPRLPHPIHNLSNMTDYRRRFWKGLGRIRGIVLLFIYEQLSISRGRINQFAD